MQIYEHLQRLDLRFYDRNPVGRLMTRVTTDVDVLNDLFTAGVVSIFGDVFTLLGIMIVLVTMDWRLALVAFAVLPLIVLVTQWFRRNVRESYRTVRTWIARINAFLQEHITGMSTVQLFRRERAQLRALRRRSTARTATPTSSRSSTTPCSTRRSRSIGALASALIIWFGGGWTMQGTLTLGSLVAFLQYSQRFFRPISDMSEKFNVLQAAMASSERIFKLLDTPVTIMSGLGTRDSGLDASNRRSVRRRSGPACVACRRRVPSPESRVPSRERSAPATSSSTTCGSRTTARTTCCGTCRSRCGPASASGVVGATGAGKSTLINLLLRFYDVSKGRILVDGVDIREMDARASCARLFSLVLQDVHLFSGTIAANIRLGERRHHRRAGRGAPRRRSTPTRSSSGCRAATTSPVAERGATLSVGQKQLLSFARALAFDPRDPRSWTRRRRASTPRPSC